MFLHNQRRETHWLIQQVSQGTQSLTLVMNLNTKGTFFFLLLTTEGVCGDEYFQNKVSLFEWHPLCPNDREFICKLCLVCSFLSSCFLRKRWNVFEWGHNFQIKTLMLSRTEITARKNTNRVNIIPWNYSLNNHIPIPVNMVKLVVPSG